MDMQLLKSYEEEAIYKLFDITVVPERGMCFSCVTCTREKNEYVLQGDMSRGCIHSGHMHPGKKFQPGGLLNVRMAEKHFD
jgi:hypothetical protein